MKNFEFRISDEEFRIRHSKFAIRNPTFLMTFDDHLKTLFACRACPNVVGTLAAARLTGIVQLKDAVGRVHRVSRAGREFDVVVLPHPSGRSTWLNKPANTKLLKRSLKLIAPYLSSDDEIA